MLFILKVLNDTGYILDNVTVNGTSYQFEDTDLFRHRYTYVITGVNELGEGISNNKTFSYQQSRIKYILVLIWQSLYQYLEQLMQLCLLENIFRIMSLLILLFQ